MDLLQSIPGPVFIGVYLFYSVLILGLAVWAWIHDGTRNLPMPRINDLDLLSISYLRGGALAVVRTVVFKLWKENKVFFEKRKDTGKGSESSYLVQIDSISHPLEQHIVRALQGAEIKASLTKRAPRGLLAEVEQMLEAQKQMLANRGLLKPGPAFIRPLLITLAASFLVLVPGIAKIILGISNDKPVMILVAIVSLYFPIVLGMVIMAFKARPITRLGKAFLRQQATELKDDLVRVSAGQLPMQDATLLAAVFGVAILGTAFSPILEAFAREKLGGGCTLISEVGCSWQGCTGGCSEGSCSSGCSSSSSGCSSSGCSSGCSGGCGGCGGCGGGD